MSTKKFKYNVDIHYYMAYTEIQKRKKKEYYYLAQTVRIGKKFKKFRVFLGVELSKEKIIEEINKKEKILKDKVMLFEKTEEFNFNISFTKKILSKSQIKKIEALKKKHQNKIKLTDKDILKKVRETFLIKYTYNTNAAEGNTISLKETELILTKGIIPKSHTLREVHEIENTVKSYNHIEEYKSELNSKFILNLHRLVTQNTLENQKNEGKYRSSGQDVAMLGSKHFPPKGGKKIRQLVDEIIEKFNLSKLSLFEKTAIFHSAFILIHPFIDGNGRVSRLIFNWMMLKNGLPPLDFPSKNHIEFTDLMEVSRDGDSVPLANYLLERLVDSYMSTNS